MFRRKRRDPAPPTEPETEPEHAMVGLRRLAFDFDPDELGFAPTDALPNVWGVLMDMGYPGATVTIVSLVDGSTSMYISSGGGMIGGGQHERVRDATLGFVAATERQLDAFGPAGTDAVPGDDQVVFHALTYAGRRRVEAPEQELGEQRHVLSPLFNAGQNVITELRRIEETSPGR